MAGKLRRGFIADAERLSARLRQELGLRIHERLDPFALANHLGVTTQALSSMILHGLTPATYTALIDPTNQFSALTVCDELGCEITFNDGHSPERTVSDITHELSHILCDHTPQSALSTGGCRDWDDVYEEEANSLAGALLVPRHGAFWLMRSGGTIEHGAIHFGVSIEMFRMRAYKSGVVKVLQNLQAS